MKTFKIVYFSNGNTKVKEIQATSEYNARLQFMLTQTHDDIVSISEVTDDV